MTGPALRAARERLGLTQVELGDLIGVAGNTVARWERGELPMPGEMLVLAMDALAMDALAHGPSRKIK